MADQNRFDGEGRGSNVQEATNAAFENAWQKAKGAGKQGKPLRVDEWYVRGDNPINWSRVVLVDPSG